MADLAETIQHEVTDAVVNDELELPTLPEVALRIRDAAEDENVSAQSLGVVLSADPALSARMIKIANSPMFRATNTIEDLNMALTRLATASSAIRGPRPPALRQSARSLRNRIPACGPIRPHLPD